MMSPATTAAEKTALSLPNQSDLKAMSQETGMCISLLLPAEHANRQTESVRMRVAIQTVQDQLAKLGQSAKQIEELLQPVRAIADSEQSNHPSTQNDAATHGLAIYRSSKRTWNFRLPFDVPQHVAVASRFHVVPILKALTYTSEFYILTLSQKHTRLLRCTLNSSEELPLPSTIPTSLDAFNQHAEPDHRLENRSSNGQKGSSHTHPGTMVSFGTASDADHTGEYLRNYYNALDKQLQVLLRNQQLPLIVSGVDYEIALYHRISEYPALVKGGIHGAADSLKGGELHSRALQVLTEYNQTRVKDALQHFDKTGGDRIATDVAEIVKHAADARILSLFIAEGAQHPGSYNAATREVRDGKVDGGDDLFNIAALQTIATAGEVFVLPQDQVPGQGQAAAMLRF